MDRNRFGIIVLTLSIMLVSNTILAAMSKVETIATVTDITGEVQVKTQTGDWKTAEEGGFIRAGDEVKTGGKSTCVLRWSRGNVLKLSAFTNMKVSALEKDIALQTEKSELDLWTGKVQARANKLTGASSNFEIRTPTAIAAVRGTELSVSVDADETSYVQCNEGVVEVKGKSGGSVTLMKNHKTTVKKGEEPGAPETMTADDQGAFEELAQVVGAMLEIMQPVGNLETDVSPILIKGRTDNGNTVTINGQTVTTDESGIFTASVALDEGVNHIKIEAANKKGNITTKTRVVKYRPATTGDEDDNAADNAINLIVTSPRNGFTTSDSTISVTGTAKPGTRLTVNNTSSEVDPVTGAFTAGVSLLEGENTIVVIGQKGANSQTSTITVYKDTTAPSLIISQPAASFSIDSGGCNASGSIITCTIIGQTEEGATLTINGMQYDVDPGGTFAHKLTFNYDLSNITVISTDSAGNSSIKVLNRAIDENKVEYLTVTVSPSTITANGQDTATITVQALNYLQNPVDGATVNITVSSGGILSSSSIITANGSGDTTFTAGVSSIPINAVITATSGSLTSSTTLLLNADIPPDH